MVIWITGLSASGKTTLSKSFEKLFRPLYPNLVLLDGDVIRQLYGNDLGYSEADRWIQIKRIQTIAAFLDQQSIIVVVSALYAHDDLLNHNRTLFEQYFEVYLKADLCFLRNREVKGLYQKAFNNEMKDVVGIDIPWHEPKDPDLIFHMVESKTPEEMANILFHKVFQK